jgi:hypothetical protein
MIRRGPTRARWLASPDVLPLDAWPRRTWSPSRCGLTLGRLRLLSDDETRLVWRRVIASEATTASMPGSSCRS